MVRFLPISATLLLMASLAVSSWRVSRLEVDEIEQAPQWQPLRPTAGPDGSRSPQLELARVELHEGMLATFEFCTQDSLDPQIWADALDVEVRNAEGRQVVVEMPLVESVLAYATRMERVSCLLLAYDAEITFDGDYVVRASWTAGSLPAGLVGIPVSAHVMAHSPLTGMDRLLVILVMLATLIGLLSATRWGRAWRDVGDDLDIAPQRAESSAPTLARHALLRALVGVVSLISASWLLGLLPLDGVLSGFVQGVGVALAQVALALALVGGSASALALVKPIRATWVLWLSPLLGLALWYGGDLLSSLIPSTGVAPIQTFVSSPSGMLTVAVIAAAVPLAEELFFRGFLFGAVAQRLGQPVAFFVTVTLFTLAHLAQAWGAWGAVSSIFVTAVVLTGLRWWTGSMTVPAVVHLVHNGLIVYFTVTASSSG